MLSLVFVFVWLRFDSNVFRSYWTCCKRRAPIKAALENTIRVGDIEFNLSFGGARFPLSPTIRVWFLGCNFFVHVRHVARAIFGDFLVKLQSMGTRYEAARLKKTHFPMFAPSFSRSSFMRFAIEPTSFPRKRYALHALRSRFGKTSFSSWRSVSSANALTLSYGFKSGE